MIKVPSSGTLRLVAPWILVQLGNNMASCVSWCLWHLGLVALCFLVRLMFKVDVNGIVAVH